MSDSGEGLGHRDQRDARRRAARPPRTRPRCARAARPGSLAARRCARRRPPPDHRRPGVGRRRTGSTRLTESPAIIDRSGPAAASVASPRRGAAGRSRPPAGLLQEVGDVQLVVFLEDHRTAPGAAPTRRAGPRDRAAGRAGPGRGLSGAGGGSCSGGRGAGTASTPARRPARPAASASPRRSAGAVVAGEAPPGRAAGSRGGGVAGRELGGRRVPAPARRGRRRRAARAARRGGEAECRRGPPAEARRGDRQADWCRRQGEDRCRPRRGPAADRAVLRLVEPGRDDGDPDLVAERVVDDRAEDDVGVGRGRVGRPAGRPR